MRARRSRWWLKARYRVSTWRARVRARRSQAVALKDVHRRLELFLTAIYGRTITVSPLDDQRARNAVSRALMRRGLRAAPPMARYEGESVLLPAELAQRDDAPTLTRYRLLALEQAERLVRGTFEAPTPVDVLVRDLYLLHEAATIDARIARANHGLTELLGRERRDALARRPKLERLTDVERAVESRVRELLKSRPDELGASSPSPSASLEWARETASAIRSGAASDTKYRGLPLAPIWGEAPAAPQSRQLPREDQERAEQARSSKRRGGGPAERDTSEESAASPSEKEEAGTVERDEPDEDALPEPAGDMHGDSASTTPGQFAPRTSQQDLPPPIPYDEWNVERGAYMRRAVSVRVHHASGGDGAAMRATLAQHAPIVRRIRHQFERLRARRSLLRRQRAGAELDIDANVDAFIDRRAGRTLDDRLYIDVRPARRGLAIALLIDASASTGLRLSESQRIIDLERTALLLACEALDALGDLYAIYSFGGQGASNVKVSVMKSFAESNGPGVQARIGALEPEGFTRLGAAVRHATAQLARQAAGHRLLLILSDGRPHDIDYYQGRYGVEDSRQAIFEARASGVFPFCLTVDAEASEYLPRLFGTAGHSVLRRPEQLPTALIAVVNALLAR